MKLILLFYAFFAASTTFFLFSSRNERIGNQELCFDTLFPISPMHQAITTCMQILGFFQQIGAKNDDCQVHCKTLIQKINFLQNNMEELILNTDRFLQYDDLDYLANLIGRIDQGCERTLVACQDFEHIALVLQDVQSTLKEFQ